MLWGEGFGWGGRGVGRGKKGGNHGDTLMRKKDGRGKAKKNGTLYPSATVQIRKAYGEDVT